MVAPFRSQFAKNSRNRLIRLQQCEVARLLPPGNFLFAEYRGDTDPHAADVDDFVKLRRAVAKVAERHVRRYERVGGVVQIDHDLRQVCPKLQLAGAEADRGVAHFDECIVSKINFPHRLNACANLLAAEVHRQNFPTLVAKLLEKSESPFETALLVFQPCTTAWFEI